MFLRGFVFLTTVTVVLASLSFGDNHQPSAHFSYWYRWLETCRPDVFPAVQSQVDALIEATPLDPDSDPEISRFTEKYLQRSGVLDFAMNTPEWEDIRVRSAGRGWDSFLRGEIRRCEMENRDKQHRAAMEAREAADRRERIRREMAAQAEREREAAKKVAACAEHAQHKASLKEGAGDVPRFTMLEMEQWENWMRQNYPIRFARYGEQVMLFIDCEVQAYEAEGREMDSVLELMESAGVFAFIVQTEEWSHYVDWIARQ